MGKKSINKGDGAQLVIEADRVIRHVEDLEEAKAVIKAVDDRNLFGSNVIETNVLSEKDNLLEHRKLKHIIHSGELTESMAYDITKLSLNMACDFINSGIYSFDLFPHNFTYDNGEWILYDFGAFQTSPIQAKTMFRSTFKINFSAFEIAKITGRDKLRHYYLNRIKDTDLFKMISFKNWLTFEFNLRYIQLLILFKKYKKAYRLLNDIFTNKYLSNFLNETYNYNLSEEEKDYFSFVDAVLNKMNLDIKDVFCVGELSARWAVNNPECYKKFVYIDDYKLCDKYYNYLRKEYKTNVSTAVLYPLVQDEFIPERYRYRAIYDNFAQKRFVSDCCLILDTDEIFNSDVDINKFCTSLSEFVSDGVIILSFDKQHSNYDRAKDVLSEIFNKVELQEYKNKIIIVAGGKKYMHNSNWTEPEYKNNNRMYLAKEHTKKILEILLYN